MERKARRSKKSNYSSWRNKGSIYKKTIELGGAITGEHGLGKLRTKYLTFLSEKEVEIMRAIKKLFDPNGILNPGTKVFL